MAVDAILGLLGISRKAGKLAFGEEQVRDMVASGKCRVIFLASDAGDATRRKVERHDIRVPILTLPWDKAALGDAIGVAAQGALGLRFQARHVQGRIGRGVLAALEQAGQGALEVLEGALHAQLGQDAENGDDEDEGGNEADEGFDDLAVHGISSGWVTLREGAAGGTLMLGIRGSNAAIRRRPASMVTRRIRLHKSTTGRP